MTDYQPMSAPPPDQPGAEARGEPPSSIRTSVNLVWAVVAMSVLNALLTFVFIDDFVATAMESQAAGVTEEAVRMSVIGGGVVAIIFAGLWVVLAIALRKGAGWARIVLTVLAGIGVVFGIFGLATAAQSAVFMVVGLVTLVLEVALLYFLWQKDSSAYLKPRPMR